MVYTFKLILTYACMALPDIWLQSRFGPNKLMNSNAAPIANALYRNSTSHNLPILNCCSARALGKKFLVYQAFLRVYSTYTEHCGTNRLFWLKGEATLP